MMNVVLTVYTLILITFVECQTDYINWLLYVLNESYVIMAIMRQLMREEQIKAVIIMYYPMMILFTSHKAMYSFIFHSK